MELTEVEKVLLGLLDYPSSSGQEDAIVAYLERYLRSKYDLEIIPTPWGCDQFLCRIGQPKKLLVAHVDTVPGQLEVSVDEENIYGRGACDNKGSAAAMLVAAERARVQGLKDFGLLFTVGEEVGCVGAEAAACYLFDNGYRPELVVVGEPTNLEVFTAQKGILTATLSCKGTRAHSSINECDSATEKLVIALNVLRENCPNGTMFNIGRLSSVDEVNIVAAEASAEVSWRTSSPDLRKHVEQLLSGLDFECDIDFLLDMKPVDRTKVHQTRREASFFSEIYYFENSVVLGPGDIRKAHSDHESISRAELNRAVELYYGALAGKM